MIKQNISMDSFTNGLEELRKYFGIPGMAVIVTKGDQAVYENYFGLADLENDIPMDFLTIIPMASLTKIFSGMLVLSLKKTGVLDKPINDYLSEDHVSDSILVKHIATNTSQGVIGENFYYSFRYSWLTRVIEKEYGESFEKVMRTKIFEPFGMDRAFLLGDPSRKVPLAKPYEFDGEIKPGVSPNENSAAIGVASTLRDVAKLTKLLDSQKDSIDQFEGLYNYGLFKQNICGHKVLWAYGQQACYSSLFIRVPESDLTLVMVANNNLMSDPAKMIYGDVRSSLFALSFFKNFLNLELPREQLRAKAVAESFLTQVNRSHAQESAKLLRELFKSYPDYESYSDLTLLHNLMVIKYEGISDEFDEQLEKIGTHFLRIDADNPYANCYMGEFYSLKNLTNRARIYFTRIISAKNFTNNWYTRHAYEWLDQHPDS